MGSDHLSFVRQVWDQLSHLEAEITDTQDLSEPYKDLAPKEEDRLLSTFCFMPLSYEIYSAGYIQYCVWNTYVYTHILNHWFVNFWHTVYQVDVSLLPEKIY